MTRFGFIATYIMANRLNGTIFIGSASDLPERIAQHKQGTGARLTRENQFQNLVWYHRFASLEFALRRANQIKHWSRRKQVELIEESNPIWHDLSDQLL